MERAFYRGKIHCGTPGAGNTGFSCKFPCVNVHGLEKDWYCIDDLEQVEQAILAQDPAAEIGYFSSSFGAYITLLRLARDPRPGARAFLRAAAVTMPDLVETWVDQPAREALDRQGYFVPDYDYVREMRLSRAFLEDLSQGDVFARWRPELAELVMVHGTQDSVVPVEGVRRFAKTFGARLTEFPQGEHPLLGPGEAEQILTMAGDLFQPWYNRGCRGRMGVLPLEIAVGERYNARRRSP